MTFPKPAKPSRDRAYLARVAALPCVICEEYGLRQWSKTTVHHTICGRYGQTRTPDCMAIPLCDGHHQGAFDRDKVAIHRDRAAWVAAYGPDTDYIHRTQERAGLETI